MGEFLLVSFSLEGNAGEDTLLCVMPFVHIYGLVVQMLSGFEIGATMVTLPRFEMQTYAKAIEQTRVG